MTLVRETLRRGSFYNFFKKSKKRLTKRKNKTFILTGILLLLAANKLIWWYLLTSLDNLPLLQFLTSKFLSTLLIEVPFDLMINRNWSIKTASIVAAIGKLKMAVWD